MPELEFPQNSASEIGQGQRGGLEKKAWPATKQASMFILAPAAISVVLNGAVSGWLLLSRVFVWLQLRYFCT